MLYKYKLYLEVLGYASSTVQSLLENVGRYKEYLRRGKGDGIADYVVYLSSKGLKSSSLNYEYYALGKYVDYLEKVEGINLGVVLPRQKREEAAAPNYLSIEEVRSLFVCCESLRDKAVLACLYHCGLRVSESVNLQVEEIDYIGEVLLVRASKTGHQRLVPLSGSVISIFRSYEEGWELEEGHFLQGLKGGLSVGRVQVIVKKLGEKSGIEKRVYPHLLRHSIATHLLNNGMSLEYVSQFLGHRSVESTRRYTHVERELQRKFIVDGL